MNCFPFEFRFLFKFLRKKPWFYQSLCHLHRIKIIFIIVITTLAQIMRKIEF